MVLVNSLPTSYLLIYIEIQETQALRIPSPAHHQVVGRSEGSTIKWSYHQMGMRIEIERERI